MRPALLPLAILSIFLAAPLHADKAVIDEWLVPWPESRPRDPWVHEGDVWFVGQRSHYVARFDPDSEAFRQYPLPEGAGPHTVIVDERGAWYAGNMQQHIGLVDPDSGEIRQFPLPGTGRRDSHTMAFDDAGNIWFTVQGGNQIGYLDTASGEIELHDVDTPNARPYGLIVVDDVPWVVLFGSHKLATLRDGQWAEIDLPRDSSRPRRLAATSDGAIWYVDYAGGYLGRYDPQDGSVSEWPTPAGEASRPYAMAVDSKDRLWFVETGVQPNRLVSFDSTSGEFGEPVAIPSGGGTVRHAFYDADTNSVWFGTDTNNLARAQLPE